MSLFLKKFVPIVFLYALTACTSINGSVSESVDPFTGESLNHFQPESSITIQSKGESSLARPAIIALSEEMEEIDLLFEEGYKGYYPDATFNTDLVYTSDSATVSMSWDSPSAFFPLGIYDVMKTRQHNGRMGLAFIDLVQQGVRKITTRLDELGYDYTIVVTLFGSADGSPIRGRLIYRGEYGEVQMTSEYTSLNGNPHSFFISPNQAISNSELAALRAYSMGSLIKSFLPHVPTENHYTVTVHKEHGKKFRAGKVSITVLKK